MKTEIASPEVSISAGSNVVSFAMSVVRFLCQPFGCANVSGLRAFLTAAEQHDDRVAAPEKVDPVAWPAMDAEFTYTIADRLGVSHVAVRQANETGGNRTFRALILEPLPPRQKRVCFLQLEYVV
jgi:hypothetical protein